MTPFNTDFRFLPYQDAAGRPKDDPKPQRLYGPVFYIGPLTVCAYLIATDSGLVVIDTGCAKDGDLLLDNIRRLGFDPARINWILLTHWHWDHTGGAARLAEHSGAEVMIHELDADIVESGSYRGESLEGAQEIPPVPVSRRLQDGDAMDCGALAPGDPRHRTVVFWSSIQGVVQLEKMSAFEAELFDPRLRVPELARTLLHGWGADPEKLDRATSLASAWRQSCLESH